MMKRLLCFLICSVLVFSSVSFAVSAAESNISDTKAAAEIADTAATADEAAPTGYSVPSETEFLAKLNALRVKYPDGSVWEGVYYEDGQAKAWTCFAYAAQMMYEIFGLRYIADRLYELIDYNSANIFAGDIVRIDGDSHSIYIIKVTSSGYYYTDGNGTGVYNQIRWDGYFSKQEMQNRFTYRLHIPGHDLRGTGIVHTLNYHGGGGSGSMEPTDVATGKSFTIKKNEFTRDDYDFAGYTVKRHADNTFYTTDAGWQTQAQITQNGYHYKLYQPGESYSINSAWLGNTENSSTFTFYAQWLPKYATVEYMANYSCYNYLLGSDLGSNYGDYLYARDTANYTLSVDTSQKLHNANSLKIVARSAGSSDSDMAFITSTNKGYGNGFSPAANVGDDKTFTLRFYAKASVDGAKMYFRWGNSNALQSVTLTKNWKGYSVSLPKNRYCSYGLYPFLDKAGTYYLNSMALSDNQGVSNVVPETAVTAASSRSVPRGDTLDYMPTPVRDGYVFMGWYTAAEGGTLITPETPINYSTVRLYAHWRKDIAYEPVKVVKYDGHIYEIYDNQLRWVEAAMFCAVMGGHLVIINDQQENNIVRNMISDRQGYCWLGLRSVDSAYDWQWMDDTPLRYTNWFDDDYGARDTGEDYAMMYPMTYGGKNAGEWDKCIGSSFHCSYYGYFNSFFICEFDLPTLRGDANGDGEINTLDATLIQYNDAGFSIDVSEDVILRADVDGNDTVDIADATYILRYGADIETPYAIGERIK